MLAYTGLGFPNSGCKIYLDDPAYDGKAGKQMVSVLAGTKSYVDANGKAHRMRYVAKERKGDPRVGMIGGSYGGQIQYAVAMQDKRVDALIPIITWNDLSYSLAPNNTSLARGVTYNTPGVGKKQWVDLFFSVGITDGVQGGSVDPSRNFPPCPNFADDACPAAVRLNTLGYPDAGTLKLARHASVSTYLKRVKAPTLVVQGQKDTLFNIQEAVATFRGLRAQGTPARMIWQSWGHSDSSPAPGELDFNAKSLRSSYLGNRFLNWMNHYVKGNTKAPVGARFSYFRDWVKYDTRAGKAGTAIRKAYAVRSTFSEAPTATLYFTGTDGLTRTRSQVATGSASYGNAGPGADVVLRDLGARGRHGQPGAQRRARHVRVLDDQPAGSRRQPRRLLEAAAAPRRPGRRGDPGRRPGRQARAVREDLRRRPRRHAEAAEPADLAGAGHRRHEAGLDHAAGCRPALPGRAPDPGDGRGQRLRLRRQPRSAAGDREDERSGTQPDPAAAAHSPASALRLSRPSPWSGGRRGAPRAHTSSAATVPCSSSVGSNDPANSDRSASTM